MDFDTDLLRRTFRYEDGRIYWRVCSGRKHAGDLAGSRGRLREEVRFRGQSILSHRLVWHLLKGSIPDGMQIDHIDHNPLNNRIENLRLVSHHENQKNLKLAKNNKTGASGVFWEKRSKRFKAVIRLDGKDRYLGSFKTIEEAAFARKCGEEHFGFHPNHGQVVQLEAA